MTLDFLTIGEYQHKEAYLQHISCMVNVALSAGDTSLDLFSRLRKHFNESPKELQASEDWIKLNEEGQSDKSVFKTVLCKNDCYAAFNLRT